MVDYFCFPIFLNGFLEQKENRLLYEDCINDKDYESVSYILFNLMLRTLTELLQLREKNYNPQPEEESCPSRHMCLVIENALRNNKCILYNCSNSTFVDINNSPVSIRNCNIYFFTYIYMFPFMTRTIRKEGGTPIISRDEEEKTLNWFKYFPIDRKMINIPYEELSSNADKYLKTLGKDKRLFVKTVHKGISGVYTCDKFRKKNIFLDDFGSFCMLNPKTQVLIATPLELIRDKYDTREWRVYVMNGIIQNISRQTYGDILPIEPYVVEYIKQQVKLANETMPLTNYVMDFMEYMSDKGFPVLTVTEFNPIAYADIYNNNTSFSVLEKKRH